jgi:hypothetical protein
MESRSFSSENSYNLVMLEIALKISTEIGPRGTGRSDWQTSQRRRTLL